MKVRPITFAEIDALAHDPHPAPVDVYVATHTRAHGMTVTPATFTIEPRTGKSSKDTDVPHRPLYASVPNNRPNATDRWTEDKDNLVGYVVTGEIVTIFASHTGAHLFTSAEAETTAADVRGWADPASDRLSLYLRDDKVGHEENLTPVFGAQVTAGFIVEGVDADEALRRAELALRAEFGDAMRPHGKVKTRPVPDRRVNVYSTGDREVLAVNILDAEVSYYMRGGAVEVVEVDPDAPPIAVG